MLKKILLTIAVLFCTFSAFAAEHAPAVGGAVSEGDDMTHRMMMLVIQLGIILFAARLGSILFEKLKLPGVLGELSAGILIGPYLLGGIELPGFSHGVFPLFHAANGAEFAVSPELYGICTVASIVLLFMVGLETDIKLFMRYSLAGSLVGIGGVTVSFVFGNLGAVILLKMLFGMDVNFFSAPCLLLGVISTATSVGITARVLSKRGKLDSPEGVTILSGAVVDDVLGIIMLAISLGIISASAESGQIDWGQIGIIAVKAVGIWLAATFVGLMASQKISILLKWFKDRSCIAVMALGLALILAGLFEEAKLAMIIGAYVMGLSLARADINYVVREKLGPIHTFMVPVFFAVMGMMVNLRLLFSMDVMMFGLAFTLLGVAAKILGCGLPALFCNFNMLGALRVGCGMLPRGEVTLIIAGVGLSGGYITPEIFGAVVLMTLLTTIISPVVLVKLFDKPKSGLSKEVEAPDQAKIPFSFPSFQTAELLLRRLVVMFEEEGFFTHLLNRRERLYQLRKDALVINVRQVDSDIVFECNVGDGALINTMMLEVIAELEQTIKELRKPVDIEAIGRRLQDEEHGATRGKLLAKHISIKALQPHLKGRTKGEVIDELLAMMKKAGLVKDVEGAKAAVMSREESMSTGMQYGIAIPHGRTDVVDSLVCAIGIKPGGLDFDSIDSKPSDIIVLTLSPKTAATPHVQFMSMISQALNEGGREALKACEKPREMFKLLTGRISDKERAALMERKSVMDLSLMDDEKKPEMLKYLETDLITVNLQGRTKQEVITELLNMLVAKGSVKNFRQARAAVMEREKQMSSGLAHGVAIPHARCDCVDGLVCAVGLKKGGIDFGALDGELSRIIVLTLSPKDVPAPHVQFMAMVSRALNAEGRAKVLEATEPEQVLNLFVRAAPSIDSSKS